MGSGSMLWKRAVALGFLLLLLAGCGGVKGDYACDSSLVDSMRLEGGGKAFVTITFLGQKTEQPATYTEDGDKVTVTVAPGQSVVFTHSGKVLDGGQIAGKCTLK
jgi:hypothetical protein